MPKYTQRAAKERFPQRAYLRPHLQRFRNHLSLLLTPSLHHPLRKAYHPLTYSLSQESALSGETSAKTDREGELSLFLPHSAPRNKVLAAGVASDFGQVVFNNLWLS